MRARFHALVAWGWICATGPGPAGAQEAEEGAGAGNPLGKPVEVLEDRFDQKELKAFLATRTDGTVIGRFGSYCSLLYALHNVALLADEGFEAGDQPLHSPYPESYRPTWKEKLDMICRQVGASWKYNHDTGYWILTNRPLPLPYELTPAKGWTSRDQGNHVVFVPPNAPVGMDVYVMGHYSPERAADPAELYDSARTHIAEKFAKNFDPDVTAKEMKRVPVAGGKAEALFYMAPAPTDPDKTWRQWAFVQDGWCFLIVSLIAIENEAENLPAVEGMIKSFRMAGLAGKGE